MKIHPYSQTVGMDFHPYSQTVRYIAALGFMGEQVITKHLNENPGKIRNQKKKYIFFKEVLIILR